MLQGRDFAVSTLQAVLAYNAVIIIYRLYFDPLSKFPGPKLYAISNLPYLFQDKILGTWVKSTTTIHAKYGPIVRIAPNRLAMDGSIGWKEIFMRRPNLPEFGKSTEFYGVGKLGIFPVDREDHRRQRRAMAHAFSAAALQDQEDYVKGYVDILIQRMKNHAAEGKVVDVTRWYNYLTFDIIGELAFGEPFGCLKESDYHPLVAMIFGGIRAQARAFIVAGSETTATALSGFTFHITRTPEVYQRLVAEIRSSFASEGEINMRSTRALPYLLACIEETLRIFPPASETPPRISPGCEIAGKFIPQGTYITVYQWATYHNPTNFADPETFIPERWLPEAHPLYDARFESDNKAAFKPFSAGPRDCIGKNLAYAEMRLVVARLLWNFDISALPRQDNWESRQRIFIVSDKEKLVKTVKLWDAQMGQEKQTLEGWLAANERQGEEVVPERDDRAVSDVDHCSGMECICQDCDLDAFPS
ncbi:cytochrome P450 [Apiospora arundinis]